MTDLGKNNESTVWENYIISSSPRETMGLGQYLAGYLEGGEIILLNGPLGVGKTVLVQGIAFGLGVKEPVKSPSFVLEKIYRGRLTLHHFDFYRLTEKDVEEGGFLWELDESSVTVIEWAQRVPRLKDYTLNIEMAVLPGDNGEDYWKRSITVRTQSPFWRDIVLRMREGVKPCK